MTDKSDDKVGHLNTILAIGGGNLNDPIFKSSNAWGLPGGGGGGILKFRVDRRIMCTLIHSKLQHPLHPWAPPRAFNLLKIGLLKFPPCWAKRLFKCSPLAPNLMVKCPSPKTMQPFTTVTIRHCTHQAILGDPGAASQVEGIFVGESVAPGHLL